MGQDDHLADIVLRAYLAAREPSLWPQVMNDLTKQFDGVGSVIEAHDLNAKTVTVITGADFTSEERRRSYETYYAHICPRYRLASQLSPDSVSHDDLIGDERFFDRDEYHNDFLKPQGLRYHVGGSAIYEPTRHVILSVQRPPSAGRIDADGIERFASILPHLGAAFALSWELESARAANRTLEDAFSDLAGGLALLDQNGSIVYLNRPAEAALASGPPIVVRDGRLYAVDAALQKQIDERIARATAMAAGELQHGDRAIRIDDGASGGFRLRFAPLPPSDTALPVATAACVAVLIDRFPPPFDEVAGRLMKFFNLTPTEAALAAAFAEGATQAELAEQRGISIHTVRTHFARIRDKLDARTLADLVRIVLRA